MDEWSSEMVNPFLQGKLEGICPAGEDSHDSSQDFRPFSGHEWPRYGFVPCP